MTKCVYLRNRRLREYLKILIKISFLKKTWQAAEKININSKKRMYKRGVTVPVIKT